MNIHSSYLDSSKLQLKSSNKISGLYLHAYPQLQVEVSQDDALRALPRRSTQSAGELEMAEIW
jgi:hypothetical protein